MKQFGKKNSDGKLVVAYLKAQEIWFYTEKLNEFVVFPFPPELMHHLEISHVDKLYAVLNDFIVNAKINPSELFIILSGEVYFLRDIESQKGEKREDYIRRFTDNLPFEIVFVKDLIFDHKEKIVGLNRYTYQPLVLALTKIGFNVSTMIPDFVLNQELASDQFTTESAHTLVLSDNTHLEKYNFLAIQEQSESSEVLTIENTMPDKKKVLPLVAVFILLLTVLGVLIWYTQSGVSIPFLPAYSDLPAEETITPADESTESATNQSTEVTTEASSTAEVITPVALEQLTVLVADNSADSSQYPLIRDTLNQLGIQQVNSTQSLVVESENIIVVASPRVSQDSLDKILVALTQPGVEITIEKDSDLEADLIITLPAGILES